MGDARTSGAPTTGALRVRKLRALRLAAGWEEVKVWVPSQQDAKRIMEAASSMRARARALEGLDEAALVVSDNMKIDAALALAENGQAPYPEFPDAVVDLLGVLAEEGSVRSFAQAFAIVVRARPAIVVSAKASLPGLVSKILQRRENVFPADFRVWEEANRLWKEVVIDAIRDPDLFEKTIERMAEEIRRLRGSDGRPQKSR